MKKRKLSQKPKATSKINLASAKQYATKGVGMVIGMAAGAFINKQLSKKDAVSGTDLLGLDDKTSKWVRPTALIVAGMAANALVQNEFVKNAALGLGAVGGVQLINTALGDNKISLSGDELIPGVGDIDPIIPGVGAGEIVEELPSANYQETHYNPNLGKGDIDLAGEDDDEDIDFKGIFGDEEATDLM